MWNTKTWICNKYIFFICNHLTHSNTEFRGKPYTFIYLIMLHNLFKYIGIIKYEGTQLVIWFSSIIRFSFELKIVLTVIFCNKISLNLLKLFQKLKQFRASKKHSRHDNSFKNYIYIEINKSNLILRNTTINIRHTSQYLTL